MRQSSPPDDLNQLLQPIFDPEAKRKAVDEGQLLAKGINAGPGAATGRVSLHAEDAGCVRQHGQRRDGPAGPPRDQPGGHPRHAGRRRHPHRARRLTSHAALVGRQMGKVCIVGCGALDIDYDDAHASRSATPGVKEGDWISIDGFTGEVIAGAVDTRPPRGRAGADREDA